MIHKYLRINRTTAISFLIASVGLCWQVRSISNVYFNYETQVDITIEVPYKITMPGLTICTSIGKGHWSYPVQVNSSQGYFSPDSFIPIYRLADVPLDSISIECRVPATELPRLDLNREWLCSNIVKPKVTFQYLLSEKRVVRCLTYFYRGSNEPEMQVINSNAKDFYIITIEAKHDELISFYIHNPTQIAHLSDDDTISFRTDQFSKIVVGASKFIAYLLPQPFRTLCRDYDEYEFGRFGCIFACWQKATESRCPVWTIRAPASPNIQRPFMIRNISWNDCHVVDKNPCYRECQAPQCNNLFYSTTSIYTQEQKLSSNRTFLYVRRPFGVEFTYSYKPRLAWIEYVCYVASCFGIWFGLSFTDCFYVATQWIKAKLKYVSSDRIPKNSVKLNHKGYPAVIGDFVSVRCLPEEIKLKKAVNYQRITYSNVDPIMDYYRSKLAWQ